MSNTDSTPGWAALVKSGERVHFDEAPVGEVICDLQLEDMGWQLLEYGRYYESVKDRFPKYECQPELPALDRAPTEPPFQLVTEASMPRVWFIEQGEEYLLQLQRDRFILNWRRLRDDRRYPHFLVPEGEGEGVWNRFHREWTGYTEFCQRAKGRKPRPRACELAYVNHLAKGKDWEEYSDIGQYLKPFESLSGFRFREGLASGPEGVQLSALFNLPGDRGKLLMKSYSGKRKSDNTPMVFVELRARGSIPKDTPDSEIARWFETAHNCIAIGFVDMATEEGRRHWRYEEQGG